MSSVHVTWLEFSPKTLLFEFKSNFQVEDYLAAVDDAWKLIGELDNETFYVAADVSKIGILPLSMASAVSQSYKITDPNFAKYTILIGAPPPIQYLVRQVQVIVRSSTFGFVDTMDKLHEAIRVHAAKQS